MCKLNILPIYDEVAGKIIDGAAIKAPKMCLEFTRNKCGDYYKRIKGISGFHQCPYGFSSFVFDFDDERRIITSCRVKGISERRKIPNGENTYNPNISQNQFMELYSTYIEYLRLHRSNKENKRFITDLTHEIKNFNSKIVYKSDQLATQLPNYSKSRRQELANIAKSILVLSQQIEGRFLIYDATVNPEILHIGKRNKVNLYQKFDKARKCYEDNANEKGIKINFRGNGVYEYPIHEYFELLPFLLIENAIKYSPNDEKCEVLFDRKSDLIKIEVSSIGPLVECDEIDRLTQRGYRGKNVNQDQIKGMGIGLYLVKQICIAHEIEMNIECKPYANNKGEFVVTLKCNKVERQGDVYSIL